jgi:hypothetical protein
MFIATEASATTAPRKLLAIELCMVFTRPRASCRFQHEQFGAVFLAKLVGVVTSKEMAAVGRNAAVLNLKLLFIDTLVVT